MADSPDIQDAALRASISAARRSLVSVVLVSLALVAALGAVALGYDQRRDLDRRFGQLDRALLGLDEHVQSLDRGIHYIVQSVIRLGIPPTAVTSPASIE